MAPERFGSTPDGHDVHLWTLGEAPGPVLQVLELGATVHRLEVTAGDGSRRNIALGHATVADYLDSTHYIGATVGRYANRIAGGRIELDGAEHRLATNDRGHTLHGGPDGFHRRTWAAVDHGPRHLELELVSPDGDQGFPGTVTARVRFEVEGDVVRTTYRATTDATTVVALTGHAYFDLDGEGADGIDDHLLTVHADGYLPTDTSSIPTGEVADVAGTPFDLREPTRIGAAVRRHHPQLLLARGVDHNYVLRGSGMREVAVLDSPASGLRLAVHTDQPGLQVYTGNFLDGTQPGTSGGVYRQGAGIALEPQCFPDSPHHPEWPGAVLRPGEEWRSVTELHVGARPL